MVQRIQDDDGAGTGRGGSPFASTSAPVNARGGFGAETSGVTSSNLSGNVHSSRGFRRALRGAQARSNRLSGQLPSKNDMSGPKYRKPSYFAQGGQRHGMHIGAGAPATSGAQLEGESD